MRRTTLLALALLVATLARAQPAPKPVTGEPAGPPRPNALGMGLGSGGYRIDYTRTLSPALELNLAWEQAVSPPYAGIWVDRGSVQTALRYRPAGLGPLLAGVAAGLGYLNVKPGITYFCDSGVDAFYRATTATYAAEVGLDHAVNPWVRVHLIGYWGSLTTFGGTDLVTQADPGDPIFACTGKVAVLSKVDEWSRYRGWHAGFQVTW